VTIATVIDMLYFWNTTYMCSNLRFWFITT